MTRSTSNAALETPSLTVTTNLDVVDAYDGKISLREAIARASAGDAITFALSLKGQTIKLAGSQLEITQGITVDASSLYDAKNDVPGVMLDADGKSRVFYLTGGTTSQPITLKGLAITGGAADGECGAGLYVASGATAIANSLIVGNTTASYGGGVCVETNAFLSVENVEISSNSAECGGAIAVFPGATARIDGSILSGNQAKTYDGGALQIGGVATFANSEISGDTSPRNGGGICAYGTAVTNFTNCSIVGNTGCYGGGYITYDATISSFTNCLIAKNASINGGQGGGLKFTGDGWNSTLTNCSVVDNVCAFQGGIYVHNGPLTLRNTLSSRLTALERAATSLIGKRRRWRTTLFPVLPLGTAERIDTLTPRRCRFSTTRRPAIIRWRRTRKRSTKETTRTSPNSRPTWPETLASSESPSISALTHGGRKRRR